MSDAVVAPVGRLDRVTRLCTGSVRFGWTVIVLVFGTLVVWSMVAPFEGAVLTSGQVAVETSQQAVQHLEGGIVNGIFVHEADTVEAGQTLIALDATAVDANLQALEARLVDLLGAEARLLAERDGASVLDLRPGFEDIARAPKMVAVLGMQHELLVARQDTVSTQLRILEQRILQLQTRIEGMESEIASKETQIALLQDETRRFEILAAKGNASEVRVLALKRELSGVDGEKEGLRSEIAATRVQIGEARSEIVRLRQDRQESILTELRNTQTQIDELSEQRTAAIDRKKRLAITAPRSGRVIGIKAHTVGGVINPSDPIMYIVPEGDRLVAKVRISPADIDKVSVGQDASLRFEAFNQVRTPRVDGKIIKVSADVLSDPATGALFYEAMVAIPDSALESASFPLVPGMPVSASLQTESRNVLSYLTKPLWDSVAETFRE